LSWRLRAHQNADLHEQPTRQRLAALHRAGVVRMAGPFAGDTGAMIIFDVPDGRALDELIADDPYLSTPGVKVHQIWHWQPFLR
jgi:uncharacterized protein